MKPKIGPLMLSVRGSTWVHASWNGRLHIGRCCQSTAEPRLIPNFLQVVRRLGKIRLPRGVPQIESRPPFRRQLEYRHALTQALQVPGNAKSCIEIRWTAYVAKEGNPNQAPHRDLLQSVIIRSDVEVTLVLRDPCGRAVCLGVEGKGTRRRNESRLLVGLPQTLVRLYMPTQIPYATTRAQVARFNYIFVEPLRRA
eukprot:scaffold223539_cov26-Tisochrysis_lutea.AAC.3